MLSFEEKKAIFHSFKLEEKQMSNGKVSFHYPESKQRGQVLATQLHSTGNGYVVGKYMSEETIKKNGYTVDSRGWISIKDFSKEELEKVITEAMNSMHSTTTDIEEEPIETLLVREETIQEDLHPQKSDEKENEIKTTIKEEPSLQKYKRYRFPCHTYWTGLTKAVIEFHYIVWTGMIRK